MAAPGGPCRVAFDVTSLLGPRTGVGTFAGESLARLAAREDLSVKAFAVTLRGSGRVGGIVPVGVALARGPMAARPLHWAWARWAAPPIEWWTGPVDVVHGPNFVVPPSRRAAQVVTVHDLTPLRFPEMADRATLAFPHLVRKAVERGAHVHTVSRFVAGEVQEALGVPADRVAVVPNGVSPSLDEPASGGHRLAGGDRYVLALGTVEPRKDLPTLVQAFDELARDDADLRLVIAGPDGWGADQLTEAIGGAAHGSRIVRLGWVDERQRAGLLRGASALAYPSVYEGFGIPPLEAMSVGTPVVTTSAGALPETVGDAALQVEPRDPAALAAALRSVLDDPALAGRLVEAGHERVARYSWEATAEGLATLYHEVSGSG